MKKIAMALGAVLLSHFIHAQPPTPQFAPQLPQIHATTMAWADYDLDGRSDLFLAGLDASGQRTSILLRNDSTIFTPIPTGLPNLSEAAAAWGDCDGDGDPDLLVTGQSNNGTVTQLWRNDGTAGFTRLPIQAPALRQGTANWADLDNDNDLDLFLTGYNYNRIYLCIFLRNDGAGQFSEVNDPDLTGLAHTTADVADMDGDNLPEIAVAGYDVEGKATLRVYKNLGGFDFSPIFHAIPEVARGTVEWADIDNDNDADLLICGVAPRRTAAIWQNNQGVFSPVNAGLTEIGPGALSCADFDQDSRMDLLICGLSGQGPTATVLRQTTTGNFIDNQPGLPLFPMHNPQIAWQDWSGDGYPDFIISGQDAAWQPVTLLYRYLPASGEFKY